MSSNDSITMVLKCMLKGAADFLIKPVRKNELRNLWQHVWRRQTVCFCIFLLCLIFLDSFCFFVLLWHKNQLIHYILFYLIPFLQLTGGGYVCQKIEASSENNAASNHSSDCYVYTQKNIECSEKGSDAQVSTFSCCSHS